MPVRKRHGTSGFVLRVRLNGRDCWLPISSEAPAEVHWANEVMRGSAGFEASLKQTRMIAAQIWLTGCAESNRAHRRISSMARQLLQVGMEAMPHRCIPLGCIPSLEVRDQGGGNFDVTIYTECVSDKGQRAIELAALAIAEPLAQLVACEREPTLEIGLVQATRARVRCSVDVRMLGEGLLSSIDAGVTFESATLDALLYRFGMDIHQPELAAAHNAYVVQHLTEAALALGLEPSRVAAAAQSEATRWGSCEPLGRWRRDGNDLLGQLEMPVDLESACRTLTGPGTGDEPSRRRLAGEVFLQLACVGLAASLAYVRLVLVDSIQQGEQVASQPAAPDAANHERAVGANSMVQPRLPESGVRRSLAGNRVTRHRLG
jgi:hypothetical protein